jgi:Tfp pilus assembly protein PilV
VKTTPPRGGEAFSLVEVTVAIGIFAFVIVGIIGLFPTALKMQARSSVETRSSMIAQQIFDQIDMSIARWTNPSANVFSNMTLRDGPGLVGDNSRSVNLLNANRPIVVGFAAKSSMPFYMFTQNGQTAWTSGINNLAEPPFGSKPNTAAISNDIITLAKVSAISNIGGNPKLYQVVVEVRSPAISALSNTTPSVFTSLRTAP